MLIWLSICYRIIMKYTFSLLFVFFILWSPAQQIDYVDDNPERLIIAKNAGADRIIESFSAINDKYDLVESLRLPSLLHYRRQQTPSGFLVH